MQVTYVGDPRAKGDGPDEQEIYGIKFIKNKPQELDDNVAAKFKGHSHFVVDKAAKVPEGDKYDAMTVAELRAAAEARGIEHEDLSKTELRAALRAKN